MIQYNGLTMLLLRGKAYVIGKAFLPHLAGLDDWEVEAKLARVAILIADAPTRSVTKSRFF